jgi:hypothetical protein
MNMRRVVVAVIVASGIAVLGAAPAMAGTHSVSIVNCTYTGYGYSTSTYATTGGSGCEYTRARIQRLVNGSVLTYDGTAGFTSSVGASNGYRYGNFHYARAWYSCS